MVNKHLAITILLALTQAACTTGSDPSSNPSLKSSNHLNSSNTCPTGVRMTVDGKVVKATAPNPFVNPFGSAKNPGLEINDHGKLSIGLITEEAGTFDLLDFDATNLRVGTFAGDKFRLTLSFTPYSNTICQNVKSKRDSKFIIEKYDADTNELAGCFYGKLDCEGKLVEVNAAVSGTIP